MVVNQISSTAVRDPVESPKQIADKEAPPSKAAKVEAKIDEVLAEREESEVKRAEVTANAIDLGNRSISFTVNEELEQVVAKITDNDTGEVIREVPSKELQDIAARLQKAAGRLLDQII